MKGWVYVLMIAGILSGCASPKAPPVTILPAPSVTSEKAAPFMVDGDASRLGERLGGRGAGLSTRDRGTARLSRSALQSGGVPRPHGRAGGGEEALRDGREPGAGQQSDLGFSTAARRRVNSQSAPEILSGPDPARRILTADGSSRAHERPQERFDSMGHKPGTGCVLTIRPMPAARGVPA